MVHIAYFKKSREPRHLDEALDHVGGALEEYRKAKAAFYIERAERVRARILASRTGEIPFFLRGQDRKNDERPVRQVPGETERSFLNGKP